MRKPSFFSIFSSERTEAPRPSEGIRRGGHPAGGSAQGGQGRSGAERSYGGATAELERSNSGAEHR